MRQHICFFSGDITNGGGTERVSTLIANQLSNYSKKYRICVVSLVEKKKKPAFEISDRICRSALSSHPVSPGIGFVPIIGKLIRFIRKNKVDILIDIDGVLDILSIPAKFLTGVKVISWEHFNYYQQLGVSYRKYIRRLATRFADAIVTLTEEDKGYYLRNLKIHGQIEAIHNPAGYIEVKALPKENMILSVGRLTTQKGFDYLIKVARLVLKKHGDWKFVILGEGEKREKLTGQIQNYGLDKKVLLMGNVENVGDYYGRAKIFCMTSRYEGLPMTLLEAKTFRLPIVSFDIKTGPKDIIMPDKNGKLVEPFDIKKMADCINELIEDEALRHSFALHSQDNIDQFNLDRIIKQWMYLLSEIGANE